MGRADSKVSNLIALVSQCKDAIEMLRFEAENVGGAALIDVSCASGTFDGSADGTFITFKNRQNWTILKFWISLLRNIFLRL